MSRSEAAKLAWLAVIAIMALAALLALRCKFGKPITESLDLQCTVICYAGED